ncbi:hypothetical protein [Streptomyces gilvus]|nr:hypothetical protein [Streptomyces sp. CME 23]
MLNLSLHPDQRSLVLSGEADWSQVIEETLDLFGLPDRLTS